MNRKVMGLIWDAVKNCDKKLFYFIIAQSFVSIIISSWYPIFIKNIIDSIQIKDQVSFWYWIKIGVFYSVFVYIFNKWIISGKYSEFYVKQDEYFYKRWLPSMLTLDSQYFENKGSSKINTIEGSGRMASKDLSSLFIAEIFPAIVRTIVAFIYIYHYTNLIFFFGSVSVFSFYLYIVYIGQRKEKPIKKQEMKLSQERGRHKSKLLNSKTEAVISNKLENEVKSISNHLYLWLTLVWKRIRIRRIQDTKGFLFDMGEYALYIYGMSMAVYGFMTIGTINLLVGSLSKIKYQIDTVVDLSNRLMDRFNELEEFQTEIVEAPQMIGYYEGQKYIYKGGDINIHNISFAYTKFKSDKLLLDDSEKSLDVEVPKQSQLKYIFKNFSLKINGGKKIAFVGASGGGKTTLVKLILGLLNTNEGQIYIDDQKLPNTYISSNEYISLSSFYHYVGYLSQDPGVFDGNILDNLLYGLMENTDSRDDQLGRPGTNSDKSEYASDIKKDAINGRLYNNVFMFLNEEDQKYFTEEVIEQLSKYISTEEEFSDLIAKIKGAIADSKCNFVRDYDDGLLAQIGERGVKLSGGQKQRLAITKLMIKNPKLIILDEPTSALDSFSEEGVTAAMERLFVDRTIIIIAHRLQTVKKADEIIVLENNKDGGSYIAERGNHEELIKSGGIYAKMLDLQSGF